MTRQRRSFGGAGTNIRRSSAQRNAVSVLPLPVGAKMSVHSPRAMGGHPISCALVGAGYAALNHSITAGWKLDINSFRCKNSVSLHATTGAKDGNAAQGAR